MNKFYHLPSLLPEAVLNTIHGGSPAPDSFEQDLYLSEWYKTYNTHTYRMSTFFKGPILFKNMYTDPDNDWITYTDISRFKTNIKTYLIKDIQCKSLDDDNYNWIPENFPINQIAGLRSSARIQKSHLSSVL